MVPEGVTVGVWVASADPLNAGAATVPAGVNAAVPFVPVGVTVWVWPASADPVKV